MPEDDKKGKDHGLDIGKLLEEKAKLEGLIADKYTREISVMFTDLKGSTSVADTQGDMAARLLIKRHNDILFPIIKQHRGTLVKTMGDGTMSYFDLPTDAVRAAVEIQRTVDKYNQSGEAAVPIGIRVGISSGKGLVEKDDIFGDVVNVSSRFESLAESGEIYISESAKAGLTESRDEFYIKLIKTTQLKGKGGEFKVFKVFWDRREIEREKADAASRGATGRMSARPATAAPSNINRVNILDEKQHISNARRELQGRVIRKGEGLRVSGESCMVKGTLVVDKQAVMSLDGAKLFFAENAGLVVLGTLKAKNTLFSAADPAKRWVNLTVISTPGAGEVMLDHCEFHFGRGISGKSLSAKLGIEAPCMQEACTYGGGLFVAGGTAKSVLITKSTFTKCTASEGGGLYMFKSGALIEGSLVDGCTATIGGGAISALDSACAIKGCTFNKCSSGRDGGGLRLASSKCSIEESMFRGCMCRFNGGGISCVASSPAITNCRFESCSAAKGSGGIHADAKSKPVAKFAAFSGCKPNDSNF